MLAYDPFVEELIMPEYDVLPATLSEVLQQLGFRFDARAGDAGGAEYAERNTFRQMKKTAIFINTGRGRTVDEALIKALQEGWIAGAGLMSWKLSHPPPTNPLLKMENVILTAHVASASARFDPARKRRVGKSWLWR